MAAISARAEELSSEVLQLSLEERAEVAKRLLESLGDDKVRWEDADSEWRAAWELEINRRIEEVDTGKVELLEGEEVVRKIRERLSR